MNLKIFLSNPSDFLLGILSGGAPSGHFNPRPNPPGAWGRFFYLTSLKEYVILLDQSRKQNGCVRLA
jgi:hypothetical protein